MEPGASIRAQEVAEVPPELPARVSGHDADLRRLPGACLMLGWWDGRRNPFILGDLLRGGNQLLLETCCIIQNKVLGEG